MDQTEKGSPPPPLAVSAELSSCGSSKWRGLPLEATGLTSVVRTEFLMLNRGGKITMFLPHNGAIKLQECVFICLRGLKGRGGGEARMTSVKAGTQARERGLIAI